MKIKKYATYLVVLSFFVNIVGCATLQYPATPKGKAVLFDGSYHRLVNEFIIEAAWADRETHKEILDKRRTALVAAYVPIRTISEAVAGGKTISVDLIDAANLALMEVKRYLYTRQAIAPSKETVVKAMVNAGVIEQYESQAISEALLVLIELIQAMLPLWLQLQEQAGMTEAELDARFAIEHGWITAFNPNSLPVVTINP